MPGGDPLATCTLPVGVVYLLTYLLTTAAAAGRPRDLAARAHLGAHARGLSVGVASRVRLKKTVSSMNFAVLSSPEDRRTVVGRGFGRRAIVRVSGALAGCGMTDVVVLRFVCVIRVVPGARPCVCPVCVPAFPFFSPVLEDTVCFVVP